MLYDPSGELKDELEDIADQPQLSTLHSSIAFHRGWSRASGERPANITDVFVLAAEDGEAPLDAAAVGQPGTRGSGENRDLLAHALAAPQRLRDRLVAAVCPSVALEPDFLVVFGPVNTLAGFPAWASRAGEIYYGGPLSQASGSKLSSMLRRHAKTKQRNGR